MSPILDIQRRGQQIGRLRIGQQVAVIKDGKDTGRTRPARLDFFRFTTASRYAADAIADLYGGQVREWRAEFEVITTKSEIGVTVPPRDAVISQWYEQWSAGGCQKRCNSRHEQISNGPCQCPQPDDPGNPDDVSAAALERARLAKLNPPQACGLVTRISVMIPDLPGLGVWRLDTASYYAATEIGDSAALMQVARDRGVFLPAMLRIEHRQRIAGGQTKKFPVPVLEVLATFRDLATGAIERGGMAAQLPPAPGEKIRAIAAPPAASTQASPAAPDHGQPVPGTPAWENLKAQDKAQLIADMAAQATARADVTRLWDQAEADGLADDHVCVDRAEDVWEELRLNLQAKWRSLPPEAAAG
jgi:Recombination directionality factor-like